MATRASATCEERRRLVASVPRIIYGPSAVRGCVPAPADDVEERVNHYERLGVDRDVTPDELRRAYRRLASRHHPDRNSDDVEGATQKMIELNEAFDVLNNPVKRFDYNRLLDRANGHGSTAARSGQSRSKQQTQSSKASPRPAPPADDPVRRARREAKEREAAEAKARGYKPPRRGFFGRMNFRAPEE